MVALVNYGFGKEKRLLTAFDFKPVFNQTSFRIHQSHLLFFIKINTCMPSSRLGLAITKKKVKRANERNRIKRLMREYFRQHYAEFNLPFDVVLTVKQSTSVLTNAEINCQIHEAFEQIKEKLVKKSTLK